MFLLIADLLLGLWSTFSVMPDLPLRQSGSVKPRSAKPAAADVPASASAAAAPAGGGGPDELHGKVAALLERIRPGVQADGGDVELIGITDHGVARIKLHGACVGCPSSEMTLHMGIERSLREHIPQITGVEQVH